VTQCDYEAELAVVLGARVKGVSKENALEAVRGYLCANDVTARDLQFGDGQWTRGKSPDTFLPVGPRLVPPDEVGDPHDLWIRTTVNGEVLQDSTTANLVFGVDEILSYASQAITLEPGDLVLTGTPAGVGIFRDPKRLLEPGDEVTVEIEKLGALTNPVVRRPESPSGDSSRANEQRT
jgi:2-keto-4-pentenoate hydratase/2-oxohepta-3-ene-1,7-dioic acid hydratase in catechol pathway